MITRTLRNLSLPTLAEWAFLRVLEPVVEGIHRILSKVRALGVSQAVGHRRVGGNVDALPHRRGTSVWEVNGCSCVYGEIWRPLFQS